MRKLMIFVVVAMSLASCGTKKETPVEPEVQIVKAPERPLIGGKPMALPKAVIYKMNGNYADNVTIQVDAQGNIVSYPAPQDVKDMEPVALSDGWFLTRRGVNQQTVFTRFTYADYAAMKTAPTLAELKAAIIPDAKISELKTLPILQSEALEDPSKIVIPQIER